MKTTFDVDDQVAIISTHGWFTVHRKLPVDAEGQFRVGEMISAGVTDELGLPYSKERDDLEISLVRNEVAIEEMRRRVRAWWESLTDLEHQARCAENRGLEAETKKQARIVSGMFWQPMRCPKCNAIMLERVNRTCGTNFGSCDCGYDYDDYDFMGEDEPKGEEISGPDVFYNAPRPKDEQEEAAWWVEWRQAHPEMDDPQAPDREWQAHLDEKMGLPPTPESVEKSQLS